MPRHFPSDTDSSDNGGATHTQVVAGTCGDLSGMWWRDRVLVKALSIHGAAAANRHEQWPARSPDHKRSNHGQTPGIDVDGQLAPPQEGKADE